MIYFIFRMPLLLKDIGEAPFFEEEILVATTTTTTTTTATALIIAIIFLLKRFCTRNVFDHQLICAFLFMLWLWLFLSHIEAF